MNYNRDGYIKLINDTIIQHKESNPTATFTLVKFNQKVTTIHNNVKFDTITTISRKDYRHCT